MKNNLLINVLLIHPKLYRFFSIFYGDSWEIRQKIKFKRENLDFNYC